MRAEVPADRQVEAVEQGDREESMTFWGELGCGIGVHSWGEWEYEHAAGDCTKIRKCSRCQKVNSQRKIEHLPADWTYVAATGDCTQERLCSRCGSSLEKRVQHVLGEWLFIREEACDQMRRCSRCPYTEDRVEHSWNDWHYRLDGKCEQTRECDRCHQVERLVVHENWTNWNYIDPNSCEQISTCERCGEKKTRQAEHTWDAWSYGSSAESVGREWLLKGVAGVRDDVRVACRTLASRATLWVL